MSLPRPNLDTRLKVDFASLKVVAHATDHAGFDPYTHFIKAQDKLAERLAQERAEGRNNKIMRL